jgi:uridine kinase
MKPFTIGITGGSGSGKTHFINSLFARFSPEEMCLLSQDHYYKPINEQLIDEQGIENFDLPTSFEREAFKTDIQKLKKGEAVQKLEYTFNKPKSTAATLEFKPAPILVIEGLFVQYFPEIEEQLDFKIFIEAKDHLKLTRRIMRDNEERGYDLNDVLYRYQNHVMPIYESLLVPLKDHADIIIPNNRHFEKALDFVTMAIKGKLAGLGK